MASAFALAIFSGKSIFNFEIAERLRTLRYLIFTGGIVKENSICSACFLRKRQDGRGVCTFSHKKRTCGCGKAVHCAKNGICLLQNGGKRDIL